MAERLLEIGRGPICPRCGWDQFDDWHHVLSVVTKRGRLKCECGVFFIEGAPGETVYSKCYGVRKRVW